MGVMLMGSQPASTMATPAGCLPIGNMLARSSLGARRRDRRLVGSSPKACQRYQKLARNLPREPARMASGVHRKKTKRLIERSSRVVEKLTGIAHNSVAAASDSHILLKGHHLYCLAYHSTAFNRSCALLYRSRRLYPAALYLFFSLLLSSSPITATTASFSPSVVIIVVQLYPRQLGSLQPRPLPTPTLSLSSPYRASSLLTMVAASVINVVASFAIISTPITMLPLPVIVLSPLCMQHRCTTPMAALVGEHRLYLQAGVASAIGGRPYPRMASHADERRLYEQVVAPARRRHLYRFGRPCEQPLIVTSGRPYKWPTCKWMPLHACSLPADATFAAKRTHCLFASIFRCNKNA
ncbi:hypothetical protein B296_00027619 [Ensete ventricosum]|uniref:Uncharacterized protein n=1 Tax=Ensete ventricosum TaxID=4639 RepID=A0A426Z0G5_ENSVE|nr:hypothetical protein B296_00027619 [Ensete ventricosum]